MSATYSKFEFSGEMFEQAMEAEAWQPLPAGTSKQVEASEQLEELARNVSSYDATTIAAPPDQLAQDQVAQSISATATPSEPEAAVWAAAPRPATVWRLERPGGRNRALYP